MQRYPGSIAPCDHSAQTSQTISTVYWVCTWWDDSKRWILMPTDMCEMSWYTQVCRCLTECCCGCCRYGVGAPWQLVKLKLLKLLKPGLVWSRWTWRLVRSCRCCPSCHVVVFFRYGKRCSKSPSSLSMRCCSCSTLQRNVVQRQLGRSLSTRSNTPRQQREGPTAVFLKFLLFMGVSPNFGWGTPQFPVASQYAVLNSLVFPCPYGQLFWLVVTHFCRR